ncbi:MAG: polysaccharide biosynthesis tyrosine autokinase [Dysgonomonas sp.]|nr:polysaccharide biosynthesis tyrosine autokinase [Dysgonomonas sp.]
MKKNPEEDFIRIQDLWYMSIAKWHWFVVSLAISLFIAFIYISITAPIYTRSTSVLIKDDSKGSMSSNEMSTFADMGLFKSNTNINNEIQTFKSPLLMQEVIQRLKLYENYSTDGFFREKILYKNTPISISVDSLMEVKPFSCSIEMLSQNEIRISKLIFNNDDSKSAETIDGMLSHPIKTPWGDIVVSATSHYSEDFLGKQILYSKGNPSNVVNHYTKSLNISLDDEKASIINIAINDVSIQRAEDILNTLIAVYNENWVKDKNQVAFSTSNFINERLNVIENELGNVDDNISEFKSQNLMPDIQAASSLYMAQSSENSAKILSLNTQYTIANYILSYLKNSNTKDKLLPANMGIESVGIEGQITEYNTMLLRYNTMLANSSDKNPLVQDLTQSLEALRNGVINSVENLLVSLDTQIKDIQKSEKQTTSRIASSPKQAKHLLSIERQQKVKEALYLFLLQKREENELSQAFTAYNTKLIVPPSGSMFPTAPRKMSILLVAVAIGFLLPIVIIFLLENMNTTIRGRKDLASLSIPFIGEIPQIIITKKQKLFGRKKEQLKDRNDIIVEEGKRDYMNEAFRVVRTNLDFMKGNKGDSKIIMITSFNPGSGKTFTTVNLGVSLALTRKKVVAIDLDMRRGALSAYVNSPKQGVSNYLAGLTDNINELIIRGTKELKLDIIPVGVFPPNPTELLLNERLELLFNTLKEQYDYVFIDCPPAEIVADATIVGKLVDLTLFIVRTGLLNKRMLPELERIYTENKFNNMSVLLNGVDYSTGYGNYGYGYTKEDYRMPL